MASRTYATGSFRLVLDKASAPLGGFTESGGLMTTKWTGTTLKALNKELATAINFGLAPRSVQVVSVAYDGKVVQTRNVDSPRFTRVVFNSVGAALNMPSTLDVVVTGISKILPGDGTVAPLTNYSIAMQQSWVRCHYLLELGPLPTKRITAIAEITIDAPKMARNFVVSVQPVDAQPYREALKAKTTMKATVKYLTPSLAILCSLTFPQARLTQEIATAGFTPAQFEIAPGHGTLTFGA
jgi:hypothetical protein